MSRRYRLILMILSVLILLAIGWFINRDFSFILDSFWFSSGLLLLILLSLIDQPHFSKDSNVFVNAVTAAISLLLVKEIDYIFWGFLGFIGYLVISSYILMWIRNNELRNENKAVQFFSRLNRQIGRPEVIFSAFFLWGGIKQYTMNSNEFNALLWFWIIFMIMNIPSLASVIESTFTRESYKKNDNIIGKIFGVQSKNTFLVKLFSERKAPMNLFDFVEFKYSIDKKARVGLILDIYWLNQEQWIKVLSSEDLNESVKSPDDNSLHPDVVYIINPPQPSKYLDTFVGLVTENSTIEKIKFIFNSKVDIKDGQLVELLINDHVVLYQVVEGITQIEQLENKNETSLIVGEAIQLGEWSKERGRFEQYGWVPSINTPIFLASKITVVACDTNEYRIGTIPNTNYPVIINKEFAVTHHTAILGVTGSGKSVFARNLINEIASEETKVIIVDLTGEYKSRFNITNVISDTDSKVSFKAIETLAIEKSKFKSQQDPEIIKNNEDIIKGAFDHSLEGFFKGKENKSLFEIPDISNKYDILEYTRWFFWVLFQTAKTQQCFGKRVCVVLEEAHTIVPEYNSMGTSDNASKATVNGIAQIALQGRKYNIGFIVIAQRTANVSKSVLTQCNSIVAFQELDKTSSDFLSNYMGLEFIKALPTLKPRNAIAIGKAFRSTVPIIFEVPELTDSYVSTKE